MSERRVIVDATAARDTTRQITERLDALETFVRNVSAGIAPLGRKTVFAGVEFTVTDTAGSGKTVTLRNAVTGAQVTIATL